MMPLVSAVSPLGRPLFRDSSLQKLLDRRREMEADIHGRQLVSSPPGGRDAAEEGTFLTGLMAPAEEGSVSVQSSPIKIPDVTSIKKEVLRDESQLTKTKEIYNIDRKSNDLLSKEVYTVDKVAKRLITREVFAINKATNQVTKDVYYYLTLDVSTLLTVEDDRVLSRSLSSGGGVVSGGVSTVLSQQRGGSTSNDPEPPSGSDTDIAGFIKEEKLLEGSVTGNSTMQGPSSSANEATMTDTMRSASAGGPGSGEESGALAASRTGSLQPQIGHQGRSLEAYAGVGLAGPSELLRGGVGTTTCNIPAAEKSVEDVEEDQVGGTTNAEPGTSDADTVVVGAKDAVSGLEIMTSSSQQQSQEIAPPPPPPEPSLQLSDEGGSSTLILGAPLVKGTESLPDELRGLFESEFCAQGDSVLHELSTHLAVFKDAYLIDRRSSQVVDREVALIDPKARCVLRTLRYAKDEDGNAIGSIDGSRRLVVDPPGRRLNLDSEAFRAGVMGNFDFDSAPSQLKKLEKQVNSTSQTQLALQDGTGASRSFPVQQEDSPTRTAGPSLHAAGSSVTRRRSRSPPTLHQYQTEPGLALGPSPMTNPKLLSDDEQIVVPGSQHQIEYYNPSSPVLQPSVRDLELDLGDGVEVDRRAALLATFHLDPPKPARPGEPDVVLRYGNVVTDISALREKQSRSNFSRLVEILALLCRVCRRIPFAIVSLQECLDLVVQAETTAKPRTVDALFCIRNLEEMPLWWRRMHPGMRFGKDPLRRRARAAECILGAWRMVQCMRHLRDLKRWYGAAKIIQQAWVGRGSCGSFWLCWGGYVVYCSLGRRIGREDSVLMCEGVGMWGLVFAPFFEEECFVSSRCLRDV